MTMRKDVFKALVGSHNYNLNTLTSDKDYKVFYYPSFDDLYYGDKSSKVKTSTIEDVEYHDIRKLPDMLWKSNVNFIEVLFSVEVEQYDGLYKDLHNKREAIAGMNLPYLYDACMGMFYKKVKEYERDLAKGENWEKINKHVMTATRIVDFLDRYASNGWNFGKAINYKNEEAMRGTLLSIKNGEYKREVQLNLFIDGSKNLLAAMKNVYKSQLEDLETKEWLYKTVKFEVEENTLLELR